MNAKAIAVGWFVLVAPVFLSGCYTEFVHPLSTPEAAILDERLEGMWRYPAKESSDKSDVEFGYVAFLPTKGKEVYALQVLTGNNGDVRWTSYSVWITEVSGHRYINAKMIERHIPDYDDVMPNYLLLRYIVDDDGRVIAWYPSDEPFADEVKKGLAGEIHENDDGHVTVSATTSELVRLIERSDPLKLFDQEYGVFEKVE